MISIAHTKEAIMCNHQIDTFHCQQRWMDTKEDTGKSMKNVLYVLRYAKRHIAMSNSEKFKLVALAIIELCLSEGIRQSLSQ